MFRCVETQVSGPLLSTVIDIVGAEDPLLPKRNEGHYFSKWEDSENDGLESKELKDGRQNMAKRSR